MVSILSDAQILSELNFCSIATDPENLIAINTLAAMGILTDDESLIDAALSEILALPVDNRLGLDPQRNVDRLLIQHHLGLNDPAKALSVAQSAVFADPTHHKTRSQLATLLFQMDQCDLVLPILSGLSTDNLQESQTLLKLRAVGEALNPQGDAVRLAQRNIMIRPSDKDNWRILALARSVTS